MRQGRGGPSRLLRSLRGDGTLLWGQRGARAVSYCVDVYGRGRLLSGDGDVRGELSDLVGRVPLNARLRLSTGEELPIVFRGVEADAASIELIGAAWSLVE